VCLNCTESERDAGSEKQILLQNINWGNTRDMPEMPERLYGDQSGGYGGSGVNFLGWSGLRPAAVATT
jgi:hypothetical protein